MLKKEISEVLKHSIIFILVVLLLPAILLVTTIISDQSYFSVFFPVFQFGLFFWALFMGTSLFSGDRRQRGIEYLLSLPYSRLQLIGIKTLPRLCAVIVFYLVFVNLYKIGGQDSAATTFIPFTAIYFTLFLLALSLSAFSDNFIILSVTSLFSLFTYYGLLY
ncbi:MAG: ABC transporter permease subunit, partial [Candidatus Aminicenantaceae bacterium]